MTDPNDTPALDLDAILRRAEAATPGRWRIYGAQRYVHSDHAGDGLVATTPVGETRAQQDAEFIAAARSDVPALVARVRELEAAAQAVADATRAEERERCARIIDAIANETDWRRTKRLLERGAEEIRSGRGP